jgi:8-oxo-dGTP diphosphatase
MRAWVVGAAVIEGPEGLLLVRNRRRGGLHDWTTPGGVIEVADGEALLEGLAREVREETGLTVTEWDGPIYDIEVEAPILGWTLRVECHRALAFEGVLAVDDPDGIVVDARYVAPDDCHGHLEGNHPWVTEPLLEWLGGGWEGARSFAYQVTGEDVASAVVTRL